MSDNIAIRIMNPLYILWLERYVIHDNTCKNKYQAKYFILGCLKRTFSFDVPFTVLDAVNGFLMHEKMLKRLLDEIHGFFLFLQNTCDKKKDILKVAL